jgi:hypothetical protein
MSKIRNENGETTTKTKEIQGIIRDCFENLHSNNLENLEEMEKLVNTYDHPKLNHFMPFRTATIKNTSNNKCWQGCGEKGPLMHCWW